MNEVVDYKALWEQAVKNYQDALNDNAILIEKFVVMETTKEIEVELAYDRGRDAGYDAGYDAAYSIYNDDNS